MFINNKLLFKFVHYFLLSLFHNCHRVWFHNTMYGFSSKCMILWMNSTIMRKCEFYQMSMGKNTNFVKAAEKMWISSNDLWKKCKFHHRIAIKNADFIKGFRRKIEFCERIVEKKCKFFQGVTKSSVLLALVAKSPPPLPICCNLSENLLWISGFLFF